MCRNVFFFFLTLLILSSCSKDKPVSEIPAIIVASVDDLKITETSFQRAYLPVLLYGDKFDSEESRAEVLNYLIGQKLLSQTAIDAGLDTSKRIQKTRDRVERQAMSRQLYRKWVKEKLQEPSEQELRTGFIRGHKSIFARHLFSNSESEIRKYAQKLADGSENFYTLAQDVFTDTTLSRSGGALGWITFGDLDESLENTLFSLQPGQISDPVESQYGWHILSVDDSREEVIRTEEDFLKTRDLIYNKINERRENVLGKQVLNDFMRQYKIEFKREITTQVWPLVIARLDAENQDLKSMPKLSESNADLESLKDETLLTVNGEEWTVASILDRLPELDRSLLYGNLYVAASNIIRDEMLTREARDLKLEDHPDVLEEVKDAYDQMMADAYVNLIADSLTFTQATQKTFYEQNQLQRYHAPDSLQVELYMFSDSLQAAKVLYQLRSGVISTDPEDIKFWLSAKDQTSPLYNLTRTLSLGTMAGPLAYDGSWTLVKLMDRRRLPLIFKDIQERVLTDMESERFSTTRNILLNEIRPKHNIVINHALLNR